jgi:hypothetical protein
MSRTLWYVWAKKDSELRGPFASKREARFYMPDAETGRLSRLGPGHYESRGSVVATKEVMSRHGLAQDEGES